MVVAAAVGSAVLCPFMANDVHSLLLFPEAFVILVLSNLYLVTRGALVPEMVVAENARPCRQCRQHGRRRSVGADGAGRSPSADRDRRPGQATVRPRRGPPGAGEPAPLEFAVLNARLTLLGTLAGFVAAIPGVILLKAIGAPAVLVFDVFVFAAAAVAGLPAPGAAAAPAVGEGPARAAGRPGAGPGRPGTAVDRGAAGRPAGPTGRSRATPTWPGCSRSPTPRCCSG